MANISEGLSSLIMPISTIKRFEEYTGQKAELINGS